MAGARSDHLLERIISLDALRWAWHRVAANKGSSGPDGVTVRAFERLLDANLLELADEVRVGSYRPGGVRRISIQTGAKRRQITILTVRDRVLQRAALDTLTPLIDPTFLSCSFGYRPGRSIKHAVARIVRARDQGLDWVVDADIHDCFASLDHDLLDRFVAPLVPDTGVRRLLQRWITVPHRGMLAPPTVGIPLGAVMSPLLCNIYLHQLDASLRRRNLRLIRYADDFIILGKSEAHAAHALRTTEKVLGGLNLTINARKTRVVSFADGFDFLGIRFERTDYSYVTDGKRIVVDDLPPEHFHYHPAWYGAD